MDELTQWERGHIEEIDELLLTCNLRLHAFNIQQRFIETNESEELVARRLRYFVIDLYTVLDYLCHLIYCHFRNNGSPSISREARNVTFPFSSNLRTSTSLAQEAALQDERNRFLFDKSHILGLEDEMSTDYQELILDCQIITRVEGDGTTPVEPQPPPTENAKALNALRNLRNNTVHRHSVVRHLVHPHVETGWLYYNKLNGSHEIVPHQIAIRDNDPGNWESYEAAFPAYWIEIPSVGNGERFRPVTIVARSLHNFVVNIRDQLLELVFPEQFPNFDETNRVRFGDEGDLYIGYRHYPIDDFVRQSLNATDLWAV